LQRFDYAIIGGGILGLSVGRALLQKKPNLRIAIVEKEDNWGQHQTGRNSGVIAEQVSIT
jgi:L-2-hydroxyglutarate oxidase